MLKMTWIRILLNGIPEGLISVWGVHVISDKSLDKKRYIISSLIYIGATVLIRMLPITRWVHTIFVVGVLIGLSVSLNKIELFKAIKAAFSILILLLVSEIMNFFVVMLLFGDVSEQIATNPTLESLYLIPSILIYAGFVYLWKLYNKRRAVKRLEDI